MSSNPVLDLIQNKLIQHLKPIQLTITPTNPNSTCGLMIKVFIVSPLFEGKRLLERQRLVNDVLMKELAENTIHAVEFEKCWTPEQYAQSQLQQ